MHWDKIFNRHECSSLTAFIFGSYLRSSRSVYGPVRSLITLSLLTMNQNICFVLVAGTRYDCGVDVDCVELDLIFTPVDKSAVCECLNTRFAPVSVQCWWGCQSGMWDVTDRHDGVNTEHMHWRLCE